MTDENFTDLMEEGLRQAARSLSDERREYIATLIARSVAANDITYIESKHLLRLLGELNDIELIRLVSHTYETFGSGEEYWAKHRVILEPVMAHMNASQEVFDKATLQDSYDQHLARLGCSKLDTPSITEPSSPSSIPGRVNRSTKGTNYPRWAAFLFEKSA